MDAIGHLLAQSRNEMLCQKAREVLDIATTSRPSLLNDLVSNESPVMVQGHKILIDAGTKQVIVVTPDNSLEARFCLQRGCKFTPLKSSHYCKDHRKDPHPSADGENQNAADDPSVNLQEALDKANKMLDMIEKENAEAKKSIQSIMRNRSYVDPRAPVNPIPFYPKRPQNKKRGGIKCALPDPEQKAEIITLDLD